MIIAKIEKAPINADATAQAADAMPSETHLTTVAEMFQVLAHATRVAILYALLEHSLCVRDIAIVVGLSESAISHQLRLLRDKRIVKTRREGNIIYYILDDQHIAALLREADYHVDHVQQGLPDHPYPLNHHSS